MERKPGSERPFEGNSLCISSLFGGTAIRRELPKALRIVTGLICALIAISRNFLGVHTPQDILVGTGTGLLVMWLTFRMLTWIGIHPEKDIQVACIGIAVSVAVAIFAAVEKRHSGGRPAQLYPVSSRCSTLFFSFPGASRVLQP
jgi:undecaprenyl-diphosphatase